MLYELAVLQTKNVDMFTASVATAPGDVAMEDDEVTIGKYTFYIGMQVWVDPLRTLHEVSEAVQTVGDVRSMLLVVRTDVVTRAIEISLIYDLLVERKDRCLVCFLSLINHGSLPRFVAMTRNIGEP
jgi:hypothetical protein